MVRKRLALNRLIFCLSLWELNQGFASWPMLQFQYGPCCKGREQSDVRDAWELSLGLQHGPCWKDGGSARSMTHACVQAQPEICNMAHVAKDGVETMLHWKHFFFHKPQKNCSAECNTALLQSPKRNTSHVVDGLGRPADAGRDRTAVSHASQRLPRRLMWFDYCSADA